MEDCIQIMGGRSIYQVHYKALFDKNTAKCEAVDMKVYADAGSTPNDANFGGLLFAGHGDGPYAVSNYRYDFYNVRTARPAPTWLRAPGMLQAALAIERVIDNGLRLLSVDQASGRLANHAVPGFINLSGEEEKTTRINELFQQLTKTVDFSRLQAEVAEYNQSHQWSKKGIALQAMKYGHNIEFHNSSVLVSILKYDGSVQVRDHFFYFEL